jgi:hypothetical protein
MRSVGIRTSAAPMMPFPSVLIGAMTLKASDDSTERVW